MSLFLSSEKMWDMTLGAPVRDNEVTHWCGNLVYAVIGGLCKLLFRFRVDGRDNLRAFKGRGVVVVCNHTSFLDVVHLWLAARPAQWIRFMGRDSLFGNAGGLLGQIISRVGAFPVKRDSADRTAIKRASRMLKNGEIVGIMPEGTRRGKGSQTPTLHSGAAFIAKMGKAPILPATVRNAEKVKQKGERVRFPKISIEFGQPLLLSDFDFLPKDERLEGATWYAMRECFALFRNVPREQVDMVALFPEDKDYADVFAAHPLPVHTSSELVEAARAAEAAKRERAGEGAAKDASAGEGATDGGRRGAEDVR